MERGTGLEPATICLEGRDSTTELPPLIPFTTKASDLRSLEPKTPCTSLRCTTIWSLGPGLNRWPRPYQGRALPSELPRRVPVFPALHSNPNRNVAGPSRFSFCWNLFVLNLASNLVGVLSDHAQLFSESVVDG